MIRRSRCSQQLGTFFFIEEIGRNHGDVRLPEGTLFMKTNPKLKPRPTWIPVFFVGSVRSGRHFPRDSAGALRERASTSAWQASQDLAGDEVALLCLDLRVRWTRLIYIVIAYFSSRFSLFGVYPPINQPGFTNGGLTLLPNIMVDNLFPHERGNFSASPTFGQTCMVMVLPKLVGSAFVLQPEMIWDDSLWCGSYFGMGWNHKSARLPIPGR